MGVPTHPVSSAGGAGAHWTLRVSRRQKMKFLYIITIHQIQKLGYRPVVDTVPQLIQSELPHQICQNSFHLEQTQGHAAI